jgi:hypothetical protein
MRVLITSLVVGILSGLIPLAAAQEETLAIIDKAIKAHGGEAKLTKFNAIQTKLKGTLELFGASVPFTQEGYSQAPAKIKEVLHLEIMGQNITVATVFNGDKGWISPNGMTMDMDEQVLEVMKEASYIRAFAGYTPLKDSKRFQLASLGDLKVNNRPAVGIKVSSQGHKDVNIYFDKETGLMAKIEHRTTDLQSMQEVAEERIVTEYQEVDGLKTAKKLLIQRDGKKFMEAEIEEVKFVDKIDDAEFAKP